MRFNELMYKCSICHGGSSGDCGQCNPKECIECFTGIYEHNAVYLQGRKVPRCKKCVEETI